MNAKLGENNLHREIFSQGFTTVTKGILAGACNGTRLLSFLKVDSRCWFV